LVITRPPAPRNARSAKRPNRLRMRTGPLPGQIFWSSDIDLPVYLEKRLREVTLEGVDLQAGERAILSLQLPEAALIVFDPVTHTAQFLEVRGEEVSERQ
jgi:uncharacterized protein DUF5939